MIESSQRQAWNPQVKASLTQVAATIRGLSIDAVQAANSGHPGLPLGCAELGAYLYGYFLNHYPRDPKWLARDRFILSAGHGSAWLYSCLHLSGFDLPLRELKNFRQLHSKTPGHPESTETPGVETTTGPLGQGVANAVGQALGLKMAGARLKNFSAPKVLSLAGDGCMMEGVCHEACSLAGHLQLDNLIVIYDANDICLDGPLTECFSENVSKRFEAYGFDVFEISGHDLEAIHETLQALREKQERPTLIIAKTEIGHGSPHKAGSHKVHGSPLGEEELKLTKENLGLPLKDFDIKEEVHAYFEERLNNQKKVYEAWQVDPESRRYTEQVVTKDLETALERLEFPDSIATRSSSNTVLACLGEKLPWFIGGSADLSCSDMTFMKAFSTVQRGDFSGKNIKFGVREFAMAAIANGLSQSQFFIPYVGTFLTFSDYMRNAIRLAALMRQKVVYQFTHDSIFLGEDGPTHQPVEHVASLRAMPNLQVIRPADANEVKNAWLLALNYEGPTAIVLSRQKLPTLSETRLSFEKGMNRGAYIVVKEKETLKWTLLATGSELELALEVAQRLGPAARVVSMPCLERFEKQSIAYKDEILGPKSARRISIEAGVSQGWQRYTGFDGINIAVESFGLSGPYEDLVQAFGFTPERILEAIGE